MKVCLLLLLSALGSAYAHTYFSSISVDGTAYAEGDCVRAHPVGTANFPIPTVYDMDMTCGWLPLGGQPANRKCPVNPGSVVTIQWHTGSAAPSDPIMDHSHKGPLIVYLAKSEDGAGPVWFKIYEQGLIDGTSNPQVWATDLMIDNGGRLDVTIPTDIAPGNYLLRGEVIALHGASAVNGAQPYVGCAEITIYGTGTVNPAGVAIPGAYQNTDPGILISIYNGLTSYTIPGPPVYTSSSAAPGGNPAPSQPVPPVNPNPAPPAPSTAAFPIYDDALASLVADYSWATQKNPQDATYAYSGSYSYSFVPQNWEAIFLYCQDCFDTNKFESIEFFVNGGASGGQNVYVDLIEGGGSVQPSNSISFYSASNNIPANTWVKGSIPLSLFAAGSYDGIWFQDHSGSAQGTLYIDAISLVPRTVPKDFAASDNALDDNSGKAKSQAPVNPKMSSATSKLVISNVVTAVGTLVVVAVVVISVYAYRKRKASSEYQYNQFVENGKL